MATHTTTAAHGNPASYDPLLAAIARYTLAPLPRDARVYETARHALMDALGCAMQALTVPECTRLLGPDAPGTVVPHGVRVPGTSYVLDPVKGAFDITCLIRWLDFSDTWLAGGHPSDSIGAVLAVTDYLSRNGQPLTMGDVLTAMIQTYEIHGRLISHNVLDRAPVCIDGTLLIKVATAAVATRLLGGRTNEVLSAISNAFADCHNLNLYRTGINAGSRKSWAAAEAASRGVWLALMAVRGEMGYPNILSAPTWGFQDVILRGKALQGPPAWDMHVMRHIQFKLSFPAQRHSQTAAECAVKLHPQVRGRIDAIDKIVITTHQLAQTTIDIKGPLPNFAARDHCMQYVVAVALLDGNITHDSYDDAHAANPQIDALRDKTQIVVEPRYTTAYEKENANPNAVQVFFRDGSKSTRIEYRVPLGDPQRRKEGLPTLIAKFQRSLALRFSAKRQQEICAVLNDQRALEATPVRDFMGLLAS
jgi:2-methylcitrate dehydratase